MPRLSSAEIATSLAGLPEWQLGDGELERTFQLPDFVTAMRFVNAVAEAAEHVGHHPDIDIRYNKVRLALSSHDSGGVTERDVFLAQALGKLETV